MNTSIPHCAFPGFWHPDVYKVGFTRLPHELFEHMGEMSEPELRVILYIFRHTWGYQEIDNDFSRAKLGKGKKLTIDEFMRGRKCASGERDEKGEPKRLDKGTGLSDRGVKNGIADALKHGYILCEVDARDKGRIKKYYSIKVRIGELPEGYLQYFLAHRNNVPGYDVPDKEE